MRTMRYKTLGGLMRALDQRVFSANDMSRGQAYFPKLRKTCRFQLPDSVEEWFWNGLAGVVWTKPTPTQVYKLRLYNAGIMNRLWYDMESRRFRYCAGQDYPGEIRLIQSKVNKL